MPPVPACHPPQLPALHVALSQVFKEVYLLTAAISLALNMINRGWDMPNTALTAALTSAGLALLPP